MVGILDGIADGADAVDRAMVSLPDIEFAALAAASHDDTFGPVCKSELVNPSYDLSD